MKTPPSTMRAVVLQGPGGPEALEVRHLPVPQPVPGKKVVRLLHEDEGGARTGRRDHGDLDRNGARA
ncbi:hypothetical protein I6B53_00310 [Schaalia sp. 19OD2882]|uniref:hypothetical protein n=1 Tax=Schaalia sp. 19OD2882 TaxID=2794089 RepID=UPI001C1EDFFB|nr:hypothetical protein [Schaalia sp. 19OD2882]QWW19628.1 hypothetical protein I6B53_00310 [Schaalia sp. 19OD2882]